MKPASFATSFSILAMAAACSSPDSTEAPEKQAKPEALAIANLAGPEGESFGEVKLMHSNQSLSLNIALSSIEPGIKAIHLHTIGQCDAPDFTSAGGHLNPSGASHGSLSKGGKHMGDLPNIEISESGELAHTIELDGKVENMIADIFDADGTAVMIHAGPDDYLSDPAGAAGPRIACGVLQKNP